MPESKDGMAGSVRVSRDFFEDDAFKRESFSEREAFLWMIMEASFKPRERRIGRASVSLQRGEFAASIRFMQKAWKWASTRRVHAFLCALQKRNMIETRSGTDFTVVRLCNYDRYQSAGTHGETLAEREMERSRNAGGTNENKGVIRDIGGGGSAGAREADEHEEVLLAAGIDPAKDVTGKWHGSAQQWEVERWRTDLGLSQQEILATVRECANGKAPGSLAYFTPAMQRAAARKAAPRLVPVENPAIPPPKRFDHSAALAAAAADIKARQQ